MILRIKLLVGIIFFCTQSMAASLIFNDISQSEIDDVFEDFTGAFSHTMVSPASSLGNIFGVEVGLVGGIVDVPGIEKVGASAGGSSEEEISQLPHAALIAAVSFPLGLTAELNYVPGIDTEDLKMDIMSLGLKWTITETVLPLPVDLALRAHFGKTELSFSDDVEGFPAKFDFENKTSGLQVLVSKSFIFVEPYAGFGVLNGDGDLKITSAKTDILDSLSSSASAKSSGTQYFVGANLTALLFKFGLEVGSVNGNQKISGKFSLKF